MKFFDFYLWQLAFPSNRVSSSSDRFVHLWLLTTEPIVDCHQRRRRRPLSAASLKADTGFMFQSEQVRDTKHLSLHPASTHGNHRSSHRTSFFLLFVTLTPKWNAVDDGDVERKVSFIFIDALQTLSHLICFYPSMKCMPCFIDRIMIISFFHPCGGWCVHHHHSITDHEFSEPHEINIWVWEREKRYNCEWAARCSLASAVES